MEHRELFRHTRTCTRTHTRTHTCTHTHTHTHTHRVLLAMMALQDYLVQQASPAVLEREATQDQRGQMDQRYSAQLIHCLDQDPTHVTSHCVTSF